MNKKFIGIVLIYSAVVFLLIVLIPRKINWTDFFTSSSREPYGLYIFKELADNIFSKIEQREEAIYSLEDVLDEEENYIFITDNLRFSTDERNNLLEWIAEGNNAFIASKAFTGDLLDTLNLQRKFIYKAHDHFNKSDLIVQSVQQDYSFSYSKQFNLVGLVNKYDSLASSFPIAVNVSDAPYDNNLPIVIQRDIGKGSIYLCTLPYAFTNYYLVNENNYQFAQDILSFLPDNTTYWDTYYKPQLTKKPPLTVFLNTKAFRWASYLGLTLLLMHMLFSIKRKQRVIPIIKPPENRSLEFTKTIGDLYHNTYDLRDLMIKMEKHFKEYVRQKYLISNYEGTEEQTKTLLAKSGKKIGLVTSINTMFRQFRFTQTSDEKTVLLLNKKLQQFYDGR